MEFRLFTNIRLITLYNYKYRYETKNIIFFVQPVQARRTFVFKDGSRECENLNRKIWLSVWDL